MKTLRIRVLVVGVLLVFYVVGYISARRNHRVVHYISYGADGCYTMHDVAGGDAQLFGSIINARVALFYIPLRYAEIACWHVVHPIGSALTTAHRQRAGV